MAKTLLIVGAGVEQTRAYQLAHEMGLVVVGSDMNPNAPAFKYADERIIASTRDVEQTCEAVAMFVAKKKIDGVMTIANDVPLTVASVAEQLNLPSISIDSARIAANKMLMKQRFHAAGINTPSFAIVRTTEELRNFLQDHPFPIVIKPIDGRGARGVFRLTSENRIEEIFQQSMGQTATGTLVAEQFADGMQISTESIVYKGRIFTAAYARRNYEFMDRFAPYIIENGGDQPADLTPDQRKDIDDLLMKAAGSMGITEGVVKGDVVINDGKPMVIELAARLSGGYFCTDQIPLATGVDLVKHVMKLALGEPLDVSELLPHHRKAVAIRYWFPSPGTITSIGGIGRLKNLPGIYRFELFTREGEFQPQITDHTKRAGFVISYAETRSQAVTRAEDAIRTVTFRVNGSSDQG
ncbi:MAG: ATP-grasp domain-containing protein [Bacteroidetes bacterium]|nr:ATP-grasp domain-containing protein [Bacteroidota bacterium]